MSDSIFTKIIKGEIPSHKIYEDDHTLAFLDIYPAQEGQIVVVPKKQVNYVWDLEPSDYQALMMTVQKVGQRLREMFPQKSRVGVTIAGFDVNDHAHVVIFPFDTGNDFHARPDRSAEPDHAVLAELAKKLAF